LKGEQDEQVSQEVLLIPLRFTVESNFVQGGGKEGGLICSGGEEKATQRSSSPQRAHWYGKPERTKGGREAPTETGKRKLKEKKSDRWKALKTA